MNENNMTSNFQARNNNNLRRSINSKPREIKKIEKRPPMKVSTVLIRDQKIDSTVSPNVFRILQSSKILTADEASNLKFSETKQNITEPLISSNIQISNEQQSSDKNSVSSKENKLPKDKTSLLLMKLRNLGKSKLQQQSDEQNISKLSPTNNQTESLNLHNVKNDHLNHSTVQDSQHTGKTWSLSEKLWPPNAYQVPSKNSLLSHNSELNLENSGQSEEITTTKVEPTNVRFTSQQQVENHSQPRFTQDDFQNGNKTSFKSSEQTSNNANIVSHPLTHPLKLSKTLMLLQKLKAHSLQNPSKPESCESYPTTATVTPSKSKIPATNKNSSSNLLTNTTAIPINRKLTKPVSPCFNCGSDGHSFRRCPLPLSTFCWKCGWDGVTSINCPFCTGKLIRPGSDKPVPVGGDARIKYKEVDLGSQKSSRKR